MRTITPGTPEDRERLKRLRELVAEELPELIEKGERLHEAALEDSLSGGLRRAVHASRVPLVKIASNVGIDVDELEAFLTGDATLRSDVIDRLAEALGCGLAEAQRSQAT
jgi:hypothetical protein